MPAVFWLIPSPKFPVSRTRATQRGSEQMLRSHKVLSPVHSTRAETCQQTQWPFVRTAKEPGFFSVWNSRAVGNWHEMEFWFHFGYTAREGSPVESLIFLTQMHLKSCFVFYFEEKEHEARPFLSVVSCCGSCLESSGRGINYSEQFCSLNINKGRELKHWSQLFSCWGRDGVGGASSQTRVMGQPLKSLASLGEVPGQ